MTAKNTTRLTRAASPNKRPAPPETLLALKDTFAPAPDLEIWMRETFIDGSGRMVNPTHRHLRMARIGVLWTTAKNTSKMLAVVGQAELAKPPSSTGRWAKARYEQQLREWFGKKRPDFLITIDAKYAAEIPDLSFCALCEHELLHCAQARDRYGAPRFDRESGRPIFGMRGHDVEEFVEIIERYGVGAGAGRTEALVKAALRSPSIGRAEIAAACGTCNLRLAA
jgi:hypothetical protein